MQNIIEQVAHILASCVKTKDEISETYAGNGLEKLITLIPLIVDPQRQLLTNCIRHALKLKNTDELEFSNEKIVITRQMQSGNTSSENAQQTTIILQLQDILKELHLVDCELNNEVKDNVRVYVRNKENLYEKDLILFLNTQIIVKKFNRDAEVKQEEQRYNGLPPDELNKLRAQAFPTQKEEEQFVTDIMNRAMVTDLNFAVISGDTFHKNYVKRIQKHLQDGLATRLSEDQFVLEGLVNLVLREEWTLVHQIMAKRILDLLAEKNSNTETFIRYFKGDVVLGDDGFRYRSPEIIDTTGLKWSASMMYGMVTQQKKAKEHKVVLEQTTKDLKQKIEECKVKIESIKKETIKAEGSIEEVEQALTELYDADHARDQSMKEINVALQSIKSPEEGQELKARYMALMGETKTSASKEYALKNKKQALEDIIHTSDARINKVNHEITNCERKIKEEELKVNKFVSSLKTLNEKYNIMLDALVGALMKKRLKVTDE